MENDKKVINIHKHQGDIDKYGNVIDWKTDGYTHDFQDNYKESNELIEKEIKNKENDDKQ